MTVDFINGLSSTSKFKLSRVHLRIVQFGGQHAGGHQESDVQSLSIPGFPCHPGCAVPVACKTISFAILALVLTLSSRSYMHGMGLTTVEELPSSSQRNQKRGPRTNHCKVSPLSEKGEDLLCLSNDTLEVNNHSFGKLLKRVLTVKLGGGAEQLRCGVCRAESRRLR